jgi:hypothetical protein
MKLSLLFVLFFLFHSCALWKKKKVLPLSEYAQSSKDRSLKDLFNQALCLEYKGQLTFETKSEKRTLSLETLWNKDSNELIYELRIPLHTPIRWNFAYDKNLKKLYWPRDNQEKLLKELQGDITLKKLVNDLANALMDLNSWQLVFQKKLPQAELQEFQKTLVTPHWKILINKQGEELQITMSPNQFYFKELALKDPKNPSEKVFFQQFSLASKTSRNEIQLTVDIEQCFD